jgi:hypothetical protein
MALNKQNKPTSVDKIGNEKDWNFSGKPISQVFH